MYKNSGKIEKFEKKIYLASPTMHEEEKSFVIEAIDENWVSTVGKNINELEKMMAEYVGTNYAVALASGTSALHLCMRLAGIKKNEQVFCSDMTFGATVNPVVYEHGKPVFIYSEYATWNLDPTALEQAFRMYPEVRVVVLAHLYGVPAKMDEIMAVCRKYGAVIVEDAAEALGTSYKDAEGVWHKCGSMGKYNAISANGNKIITGSSGGFFLTDSKEDAEKVRKWSTQAREAAPWYQHEELGYNYRMSNIVAGIARGNMLHLSEHIEAKKRIYQRYQEGLKELPVKLNPYDSGKSEPNYWLTCLLIEKDAMCRQVRGDKEVLYIGEDGKSCPTEILETLALFNAEGRPIWKPMHLQPYYRNHDFITCNGTGRARSDAYINHEIVDVGADIFERGLCLPSDNKMSKEEQDRIIEIIKMCFE